MTDSEKNKLDLCPFCGGAMEAVNRPWTDGVGSCEMCHVDMVAAEKAKCPVVMCEYRSEAEAVEHWNTRAERTCQMKKARWDDGKCTWGVICSACGHKHEHEFEYSFNFCPTCGAKVIDDE